MEHCSHQDRREEERGEEGCGVKRWDCFPLVTSLCLVMYKSLHYKSWAKGRCWGGLGKKKLYRTIISQSGNIRYLFEKQILTVLPFFIAKKNIDNTLCDPIDCGHQTLPSMEFSRQEYWSRLPFPTPGALPDPGIESVSPAFGRQILYHCITREALSIWWSILKNTLITKPFYWWLLIMPSII